MLLDSAEAVLLNDAGEEKIVSKSPPAITENNF
jgi:hypothetical protein